MTAEPGISNRRNPTPLRMGTAVKCSPGFMKTEHPHEDQSRCKRCYAATFAEHSGAYRITLTTRIMPANLTVIRELIRLAHDVRPPDRTRAHVG
jgi:hypothetical protein